MGDLIVFEKIKMVVEIDIDKETLIKETTKTDDKTLIKMIENMAEN